MSHLVLISIALALADSPSDFRVRPPSKKEADKAQIYKMMTPVPKLPEEPASIQVQGTCVDPVGRVYKNTDPDYLSCTQKVQATPPRPDPNQKYPGPNTSIGVTIGK